MGDLWWSEMAACEKSLDGSELGFRQPEDFATFPKHSLSMGVKSMWGMGAEFTSVLKTKTLGINQIP